MGFGLEEDEDGEGFWGGFGGGVLRYGLQIRLGGDGEGEDLGGGVEGHGGGCGVIDGEWGSSGGLGSP